MISIIVPMYNAEKTIEKCVKSIQASLYVDIEIILVNDGSTDKTLEICKNIKKTDRRIKIIDKENTGAGLSRQAGIEMSQGEYITFVDADDWVMPDIYIKMKRKLEQCNSDICITGYVKQNKMGEKIEVKPKFPKDEYEKKEIKECLLHNCIWFTKEEYAESPISTLWMCLYKAQIMKENNLKIYSERKYYSEDSIFNLGYLLHCNKVCFISECLYVFVRSGESMSCQYDDRYKKVDNWYEKIEKMCDQDSFKYIEGYLNNSYLSLAASVINGAIEKKEDPQEFYKSLRNIKKIKISSIADIHTKRKILYWTLIHNIKLYSYISRIKTCYNVKKRNWATNTKKMRLFSKK